MPPLAKLLLVGPILWCASCGDSPEKEPGGKPPEGGSGGASSVSENGPGGGASVATLDPPRSSWKDVGIGEVCTFEVRVVPGPDWDPETIADPLTSCECLSVEWAPGGEPDSEGAVIRVRIYSPIPEPLIDGTVFLEQVIDGGKPKGIAQHIAEIMVKPRLYVSPREVLLKPETGPVFGLEVGIAWPEADQDSLLQVTEFGDSAMDEKIPVELSNLDFQPDLYEAGYRLQRMSVEYQLNAEYEEKLRSGQAFEFSIELTVETPPGSFKIPVRFEPASGN